MVLLTVASKDRSTGDSLNKCNIRLPQTLTAKKVRLESFIMPYAISPLRSPYNYITIKSCSWLNLTRDNLDTNTYTVSETFKSISDLMTELNSLTGYTWTYSSTTLKVSCSSTTKAFYFEDTYLARHLGLPTGSSNWCDSQLSVTGTKAANLSFDTVLYISVNNLSSNAVGLVNHDFVIPITCSNNSVLVHTSGTTYPQHADLGIHSNGEIAEMTFNFTDVYGNTLSGSGYQDWVITFTGV